MLAAGLSRVYESLSFLRRNHAADTLMDAAEAAGVSTDEEFVEFVDSAISDERRQELLARTLIIAQDTALRDKRCALGRALAAPLAACRRLISIALRRARRSRQGQRGRPGNSARPGGREAPCEPASRNPGRTTATSPKGHLQRIRRTFRA